MIDVKLVRDQSGCIRQFIVKGHAGYAECGSDIVCAAVSVTAYTAAGALEELAGLKNCHTEKNGYMLVSIPEGIPGHMKETVRIIMETTAVGFKQIGLEYGKYVTVLDEEV